MSIVAEAATMGESFTQGRKVDVGVTTLLG